MVQVCRGVARMRESEHGTKGKPIGGESESVKGVRERRGQTMMDLGGGGRTGDTQFGMGRVQESIA